MVQPNIRFISFQERAVIFVGGIQGYGPIQDCRPKLL